MATDLTQLEKLERLKIILVKRATGVPFDHRQAGAEYRELREEFLSNPTLNEVIPSFLRTCPALDDFWYWIKPKFQHYQERRAFLASELAGLESTIREVPQSPAAATVAATLQKASRQYIHAEWTEALSRVATKPDGALTKARALLEATCKYILHEHGTPFEDKEDLPDLFHKVSEVLTLAPAKQTEEAFKKLCGAHVVTINQIAEIRNKLGDSHGKRLGAALPGMRHAELAVNYAGSLSTFLIKTWEEQKVVILREKMGKEILVVTLGLGPDELAELYHVEEPYWALCDRLIGELKLNLKAHGLERFICPLEDERSGETLSVRVAFKVDFSKQEIPSFASSFWPWESLELVFASDLYPPDEVETLNKRLMALM